MLEDFLYDFDSLRAYCDLIEYGTERNPVDGVEYPGINLQVPDELRSEIFKKLERFTDRKINNFFPFFRLTLAGEEIPHLAHNDSSMGAFTMLLYLNRPEHCAGGTSFLKHIETGIVGHPITEPQLEKLRDDTNRVEAWETIGTINMKPNRAVVFNSDLMHYAAPPNNFGNTARDGRLILQVNFE